MKLFNKLACMAPGWVTKRVRKAGVFLSSFGSDHMTRELHRAWKNKMYFLYCELLEEFGNTVGYDDPEYLEYRALINSQYNQYWSA